MQRNPDLKFFNRTEVDYKIFICFGDIPLFKPSLFLNKVTCNKSRTPKRPSKTWQTDPNPLAVLVPQNVRTLYLLQEWTYRLKISEVDMSYVCYILEDIRSLFITFWLGLLRGFYVEILGSIGCILALKFCGGARTHEISKTQKSFGEIPPRVKFIQLINYLKWPKLKLREFK